MKASKIIEGLNAMISEFGDQDVTVELQSDEGYSNTIKVPVTQIGWSQVNNSIRSFFIVVDETA